MRAIHLTTFCLPHAKKLRIAVLSDLHYAPQTKTEKLQAIMQFLHARHPDYIFFPGDVVDANNNIEQTKDRSRLLDFLQNLGHIAPTFITFGNHDLYSYADRDFYKKTHKHWVIDLNRDFFDQVSNLKNVYLLENTFWHDDCIAVYGLALPPDYYPYSKDGRRPTILHPQAEKLPLLLNQLDELKPTTYLERLAESDTHTKRLNFTIVHSPIYFTHPEVRSRLKGFNYFITGHMHNGLVPPLIYELWRSDRGFISPTHEQLPRHARPALDDGLIVSGAVTTYQKCSGPLQLANTFYPTYLTMLDFSPEYIDMPTIHRRYHHYPKAH